MRLLYSFFLSFDPRNPIILSKIIFGRDHVLSPKSICFHCFWRMKVSRGDHLTGHDTNFNHPEQLSSKRLTNGFIMSAFNQHFRYLLTTLHPTSWKLFFSIHSWNEISKSTTCCTFYLSQKQFFKVIHYLKHCWQSY